MCVAIADYLWITFHEILDLKKTAETVSQDCQQIIIFYCGPSLLLPVCMFLNDGNKKDSRAAYGFV